VDGRVLEGFIHSLSKGPITKICGYLQDAGFLHASCVLGAANSILHSSAQCTITLEDVALQLSLPVDGPVVTGCAIISSKKDLCATFLGKVQKFEGGRILMNWLETNLKELLRNPTDVIRVQYVRAFILRLIGGILVLDKSQTLVHVRWLLHLADFKEC
ncbi:hypothetical protein Gohar_000887, partial [Gossypium harknessii]|nr:hypothetical protein [Gossypium harknessii]